MTTTRIGRYEIEKKLGAGAMAVVYKAVDPVIGRTVAIKTIKFDSSFGAEQEELRQRLYREAQSAGNLSHPSIVTIYDIGEEGSVAYIAMEFIEGESLQEWMAKNPCPPVQQTVDIIEQIAAGLDYAAARGIIHRDIKPGNILLTRDVRAKIADFGIAKFSTAKLTQTGAIIGTPAYMSPEQAMGRTLDGRSDLFSLGVIFYEMLTGEKPFSGSNPTTIMYKILHEEPVPPRRLNVALHPAFDSIIGRMLAKDPNQRYQNCADLIQDLRNYQSLGTSKAQEMVDTSKAKGGGGRKFAIAALVIVALFALGFAGYNFYRQSQRTAAPSSTQTVTNPAPPTRNPTQVASNPSPTVAIPPPVAPPKTELPKAEPTQTQGAPTTVTQLPASKPGATDLAAAPDAVKEAPPAKKDVSVPPKQVPVPEKPARAQVSFEYAGDSYPVTVYDGPRKLQILSPDMLSLQVSAGDHRFRIVSDEVFLDQQLPAARLKADQVFSVPIPGLCSAYIEVPNDAYDGCEIRLDGRMLANPYPAQIPRLAGGNHRISFRWTSGKYAGKDFSSGFSGVAGRHYRIRGEPQTEQITVQQIR
jgi:serine/threonine protein kinase